MALLNVSCPYNASAQQWTVRYDTSIGTVCTQSEQIVYTASGASFTTGDTVYTDAALTSPLVGFNYISELVAGIIYNLDSGTGVIGTGTGSSC